MKRVDHFGLGHRVVADGEGNRSRISRRLLRSCCLISEQTVWGTGLLCSGNNGVDDTQETAYDSWQADGVYVYLALYLGAVPSA